MVCVKDHGGRPSSRARMDRRRPAEYSRPGGKRTEEICSPSSPLATSGMAPGAKTRTPETHLNLDHHQRWAAYKTCTIYGKLSRSRDQEHYHFDRCDKKRPRYTAQDTTRSRFRRCTAGGLSSTSRHRSSFRGTSPQSSSTGGLDSWYSTSTQNGDLATTDPSYTPGSAGTPLPQHDVKGTWPDRQSPACTTSTGRAPQWSVFLFPQGICRHLLRTLVESSEASSVCRAPAGASSTSRLFLSPHRAQRYAQD
jgi:hypothetical protein